jgi:nitroreductase
MNGLSRSEALELVAEATLAPSAHNAQPARWRLCGKRWELFEDASRRLPVADPSGKDARVGLGAAFEGMRLALSRRSIGLTDPVMASRTGPPRASDHGLVPVAHADLQGETSPDPLAEAALQRRTSRGKFAASPTALGTLRGLVDDTSDLVLVEERETIEALARAHDTASYTFLCKPEGQAELYEWMRFTPRHPSWERDGMTAPCLGMSGLTARLASFLFAPSRFRLLVSIRLARHLTSEAAATRSASALLVIRRDDGHDWFAAGMRLYRVWLELTVAGLAACPMSGLVDDPEQCAELRRRCELTDDVSLTNVLRVGPAPSEAPPRSPRLPATEVLDPC